jgi:3-oxoacyl-[acyl-carrier-protein] synthase-3
MGVQILATGSYVPDRVVSNEEVARSVGCEPDWILQRSGIVERRHAPPDMASSGMATLAARRCLAAAQCPPDEVDLLLVATSTPDVLCPATANIVQRELGLRCGAVDLMAACSGFVYALVTAMQYVANGCARRALVVGVDTMSRVLNPKDQYTYPLFGDGAGAVLVGAGSPEQGLASYTLGSDGSGEEMLTLRMSGSRMPACHEGVEQGLQYLEMDGRAVFRWAVELLHEQVPAVLARASLALPELDLIVLHQANLRILQAVAQKLDMPMEKFFVNLGRYGNTTAGTVPIALDEAYQQGRIRRGSKLLLAGFGAGLAWGVAVVRW